MAITQPLLNYMIPINRRKKKLKTRTMIILLTPAIRRLESEESFNLSWGSIRGLLLNKVLYTFGLMIINIAHIK